MPSPSVTCSSGEKAADHIGKMRAEGSDDTSDSEIGIEIPDSSAERRALDALVLRGQGREDVFNAGEPSRSVLPGPIYRMPGELLQKIVGYVDQPSLKHYRLVHRAGRIHAGVAVKSVVIRRREDLKDALRLFEAGGIQTLRAENCNLSRDECRHWRTTRPSPRSSLGAMA